MQLPDAGINAYFAAGYITPDRRWSDAFGVCGRQVAEAATALLLTLLHRHPTMVRADNWSPRPRVDTTLPISELPTGLRTTDHIVIAVPLTTNTHHFLDDPETPGEERQRVPDHCGLW